ncbi:hypothetical protein GTP55_13520 [Duganella sp. FT109W]|uniref:Uncharacterized protein n=1 Tax=Duganella margarita TaxID=2692170 RepID=A0ABW9WH39_9BURK|nr:hypothetical protein [Duganella margarita]MYN40393.1 hypothetical protein [Duganella margarita]
MDWLWLFAVADGGALPGHLQALRWSMRGGTLRIWGRVAYACPGARGDGTVACGWSAGGGLVDCLLLSLVFLGSLIGGGSSGLKRYGSAVVLQLGLASFAPAVLEIFKAYVFFGAIAG